MRDNLPSFDLPMKANSGNFCFGFSEILVLLPENNASVIFRSGHKDRKSFSQFIDKLGLYWKDFYSKLVSVV